MHAMFTTVSALASTVEWTQTAMAADGSHTLCESMPPIKLVPMPPPSGNTLSIDRSKKYQTLLGFGGAFTEASALNWRSLSKADQAEVIRLYFAAPEDGGLGYTVGRVPMGSCDFGPGDPSRSYSFHNASGDTKLTLFDDSVAHDVDNGMIPMILEAQAAIDAAGGKLTLFASPWSPPGWMKLPDATGTRSMLRTALPNGLDPEAQRPYAKYFSRYISAYRARGIPIWGVTVQNEAEAADVGWEKCVYTPEYQAAFVRDHLGPVLREEQPGVKIIGFDHNKDHVHTWAKALYADPIAKHFFDGIGVHWYGGLNTVNLDNAHAVAPDKFLLATEACNCPGVVYETQPAAWWERAEHLGMDILQDLLHWCTGWVDWNLILDVTGGPNHLGNRCDANIIADPSKSKGLGTLVMQASYYYMAHFSRYLPAGSVRVAMEDTVEAERPVTASDVHPGQPLVFMPCTGTDLQSWTLDSTGSLYVTKSELMCIDIAEWGAGPRLNTWDCVHSVNQAWERRLNPQCSEDDVAKSGVACTQLVNPPTGKCLTKVKVNGAAIGLDAGTSYTVAQALPCLDIGDSSQTFDLVRGDQGGFPDAFPIQALVPADDENPSDHEMCLQPFVRLEPKFAAAAFERPDGQVSVIAMNTGDDYRVFSLYDTTLGLGTAEVTVPPHSIQSFTLPADEASKAPVTLLEATTSTGHDTSSVPLPAILIGALVALAALVARTLRPMGRSQVPAEEEDRVYAEHVERH